MLADITSIFLQRNDLSHWPQAAARLLKLRHEKVRSRTHERALLGLEQLVEGVRAQQQPPAGMRLR